MLIKAIQANRPSVKEFLAEAGAYYTHELVFSLLTAIKSRPAYYTRVRIVCEILQNVSEQHRRLTSHTPGI